MKVLAALFLVVLVAVSVMASLRASAFLWVYSLPGADKTGHFLLMGTLGFLVVLAFSESRVRGRRLGAAGCIAAVCVLVTLDELSQFYLPHRTVSLNDLLASWAGILVFGLVAMAIQRFREPG